MSKLILVDFNTEGALSRNFDEVEPIGVLLEDEIEGFRTLYSTAVTESQGPGHDNWIRTLAAVAAQLMGYQKRGEPLDVPELFTYLADNSYLGLRLRAVGRVDDEMTIQEAFDRFVVNREPLPLLEDEELPSV